MFRDLYLEVTDEWNGIRLFNPNVVIHLVAFSTSRNDGEVLETLVESNITYGLRLLQALSVCDSLKLFVNTGSFAEYRLGCKQIDNAYLYSATKTAFRFFVNYYAKLGRYRYITVVPYTVYEGTPTVKRIMDYMIEAMDLCKPVDMTAGWQLLDFIHVDDVSGFFVHVLTHLEKYLSLEQDEEFHLGTGVPHTLRQVAELIEEVSGRKLNINWRSRPYRDRDTMYAVVPIARNIELTGWKAKIRIRNGIIKFLNNYGIC